MKTLLFCALLLAVGCQTAAPMVVWEQPTMQPSVGSSMLIADVRGAHGFTSTLQRELIHSVPPHLEARIELITMPQLPSNQGVVLASGAATSRPEDSTFSDLEVIDFARKNKMDYVMFGEVLRQRSVIGKPDLMEVVVSWKLHDVQLNRIVGGFPVRLEIPGKSDDQTVVPASSIASNEEDGAAVRQVAEASWELLTPHISTREVRLAQPWVGWGAKQVRQGNALAEEGKWPQAELLWSKAIARNPNLHAAIHNLALAAAAQEDYARAKRLAQQALRMRSNAHYESTFVWIEQRQLDYRSGHGLAAPTGGYVLIRPNSEN